MFCSGLETYFSVELFCVLLVVRDDEKMPLSFFRVHIFVVYCWGYAAGISLGGKYWDVVHFDLLK